MSFACLVVEIGCLLCNGFISTHTLDPVLNVITYTVESPTADPPRKGHCMLDLSIKNIAQGPKNYSL